LLGKRGVGRSSPGLFICLEGIDAVGKRTQSLILKSWLSSKGLSVRMVSFPDYSTVIGREIRRFLDGARSYPPEARAMLFAANRWERKAELEDMLDKTDAVIVDRYTSSNLAYGISNGLPLEWLVNLEAGLPEPDLVLLFDAPATALATRRSFNKDTYEKNLDLQERTRKEYLKLAERFGWNVIDATRGREETSHAVASVVSKALGGKGRTV
jgi:dTMP kinase